MLARRPILLQERITMTAQPDHEDVTTPLASLIPDRRNARRHTDRNVALIIDALREVGAARSIVVDETGTVLAGNATVEAAAQAGIECVRVVEATGEELIAVRRTGLTPEQKHRLALLDNRTAEMAEWDTEMLAAMADDIDLSTLWEPDELAELLGDPPTVDFPEYDATAADAVAFVECPNCGHRFSR
jgi:ParB-like chromosome segregation protein Spo0J